MLTYISPEETYRRMAAHEILLVDVRSVEEIKELSINGAVLAPLSIISLQRLEQEDSNNKPVVFFCRSGRRTKAAAALLSSLAPETYQMQGGLIAWQSAALPVRTQERKNLPLQRQIFIAAGSLALFGALGSFIWTPLVWLAAFVGAGLTFSGLTGFCGMGVLLSKMPWNK